MPIARAQRLARYGGRAPRYTSYPTANHFQPLGPEVVTEALPGLRSPASLYVHIPYCEKLCWYCGCNTTIRRDRSIGTDFVATLLEELRLVQEHTGAFTVGHLALGGGTPNFLTTAMLETLVRGLDAVAPPVPGAVRSTEIDPRTVDREQLTALMALGFTQISLGVQSLDPLVQQVVNRPLDPDALLGVVAHLRSLGDPSINLDLMVGLPRQTTATLDGTLRTVFAARPQRLAVFQYAHMPSLRPAQKLLARHGLPGAQERDVLFVHVRDRLLEQGYVRVGFDHYALPDDPLAQAVAAGTLRRNFQGFTTDAQPDLIALGPSAIGRIGDLFCQNDREVKGWSERVHAGVLPVDRGLRCTAEDAVMAEVIEDLMCGRPASLARLGARRAEVEPRLVPMQQDGLIDWDEDRVQVTAAGFDFVRSVAAAFDLRLQPEAHAAVG